VCVCVCVRARLFNIISVALLTNAVIVSGMYTKHRNRSAN
jgi:hypothetical protein